MMQEIIHCKNDTMMNAADKFDAVETHFGGAISAVYINLHSIASHTQFCATPIRYITSAWQAEASPGLYMAYIQL